MTPRNALTLSSADVENGIEAGSMRTDNRSRGKGEGCSLEVMETPDERVIGPSPKGNGEDCHIMQQNPVKLKAIILPTTAAGHVAGLGYRRASAGLNKCEFVIFNRMKHPHVYSF